MFEMSTRVEEFFNKFHSKSDGKFTSGGGGSGGGSATSGPTSGGASKVSSGGIKDGRVHIDGAAATGKISKRGSDVWHATMTAKHGGADVMGTTRADLVKTVQAHLNERASRTRMGDRQYGAASTAPSAHAGRLQDMTSVRAETLSKIGAAKVSQVKVSKDGSVSIKGQSTDIKITKGSHPKTYASGYHVSGSYNSSMRSEKFFKTQAAARLEVVRMTKAAALV